MDVPRVGEPIIGGYGYRADPAIGSAAMNATATTATLGFECMRADSGPIVPDVEGRFSVQAEIVAGVGRSVRTIPNATIRGTVAGDAMTLEVEWPSETYGPVTLTKDVLIESASGCR